MLEEKFSDEEWFDRLYRKSELIRTRNSAKISLAVFDQFCQIQVGLKDQSRK